MIWGHTQKKKNIHRIRKDFFSHKHFCNTLLDQTKLNLYYLKCDCTFRFLLLRYIWILLSCSCNVHTGIHITERMHDAPPFPTNKIVISGSRNYEDVYRWFQTFHYRQPFAYNTVVSLFIFRWFNLACVLFLVVAIWHSVLDVVVIHPQKQLMWNHTTILLIDIFASVKKRFSCWYRFHEYLQR